MLAIGTYIFLLSALNFEKAIGLKHDDVICVKFTPSLVSMEFFLNLCHLLVVFTRLFFVSQFLGSLFFLKFTSPHYESKAIYTESKSGDINSI